MNDPTYRKAEIAAQPAYSGMRNRPPPPKLVGTEVVGQLLTISGLIGIAASLIAAATAGDVSFLSGLLAFFSYALASMQVMAFGLLLLLAAKAVGYLHKIASD